MTNGNEPLVPMYELRVAAVLIPMRYGALRTFLYRNQARYPPRYVHGNSKRRSLRILSSEEILSIRNEVLRGDPSIIYPYVPEIALGVNQLPNYEVLDEKKGA